MKILDRYFDLQENMKRISKTNCSEEEIELYFESGEKTISMLDKVVYQFIKDCESTSPTIFPGMYIRYSDWDKARQAIDRCFQVNILSEVAVDG